MQLVAAPPQQAEAPPRFAAALHSIEDAHPREDVELEQMPAPTRMAPFAFAMEGEAIGHGPQENCYALGKFIVLFDPQGQDGWQGEFRVVTLVKADLDQELASDPLVAEIAWSWIVEALDCMSVRCLCGTVTQRTSKSFGDLSLADDDSTPTSAVEIRASWTAPNDELGKHLEAWTNVLATAAGLAPLPTLTSSPTGSTITPITASLSAHRRNQARIDALG